MSKMNEVMKKGIRAIAQATAKSSVNSACAAFIYQPKVPESLDSFAKRGRENNGSGK